MQPKISRGVRVLTPKRKETVSEEQNRLQNDIASIEKWWQDARWNYTTRTFKGEFIEMFVLVRMSIYCTFKTNHRII